MIKKFLKQNIIKQSIKFKCELYNFNLNSQLFNFTKKFFSKTMSKKLEKKEEKFVFINETKEGEKRDVEKIEMPKSYQPIYIESSKKI